MTEFLGDTSDEECNQTDLMLSSETLLALKEFAFNSGILCVDSENILNAVQNHFEMKDKDETFDVSYEDNDRTINFTLSGVKRELGQTLSSTGLTIWRAAEHLCDWIFKNSKYFEGKKVCELGAGLGLVSILLDKMNIVDEIFATDGDDATMDLLSKNIMKNSSTVKPQKVYWGEENNFVNNNLSYFDIVFAADVIYEIEQVIPLINTVSLLLKKKGTFILAFARRNVPIDIVKDEAYKIGFEWNILHEENQEPIFAFTWRKCIVVEAK